MTVARPNPSGWSSGPAQWSTDQALVRSWPRASRLPSPRRGRPVRRATQGGCSNVMILGDGSPRFQAAIASSASARIRARSSGGSRARGPHAGTCWIGSATALPPGGLPWNRGGDGHARVTAAGGATRHFLPASSQAHWPPRDLRVSPGHEASLPRRRCPAERWFARLTTSGHTANVCCASWLVRASTFAATVGCAARHVVSRV